MGTYKNTGFNEVFGSNSANKVPITQSLISDAIARESLVLSDNSNSYLEYATQMTSNAAVTGGYYNNDFEYDAANFVNIIWDKNNTGGRKLFSFLRTLTTAGDGLKYGHRPVVGGNIVTENGVEIYEGGAIDTQLWQAVLVDPEEVVLSALINDLKREMAERDTGSIRDLAYDLTPPQFVYDMDGTVELDATEHVLLAGRFPSWVENGVIKIPHWGDSVLIAKGINPDFTYHNNITVGGTQQTRMKSLYGEFDIKSVEGNKIANFNSSGVFSRTTGTSVTINGTATGTPRQFDGVIFNNANYTNVGETNSNNGKGVRRCIISYSRFYYGG